MKRFVLILTMLSLASCLNYRAASVTPESLIHSSSEKVSFSLFNDQAVDQVVTWVEDDLPSRITLQCVISDPLCGQLSARLSSYGFNPQLVEIEAEQSTVDLFYDRITATSCNANRFGCAQSLNAVQMATEYKQFTHPDLSDHASADKAVQHINSYFNQ